ncbi:MAG TPA: hypothetical protein VFW05_15355 [Verrucomicrobiae bacterium]|nr:hypothetical protein [Verrucomicrobiae bacterium]
MIVFGDPQRWLSADSLLARLRVRLNRAGTHASDDVRNLLILAGQLEQGLADCAASFPTLEALRSQSRRITDLSALAFHSAWINASETSAAPVLRLDAMQQLAAIFSELSFPENLSLSLKIPEGFAFYALFPEQFSVTASRWANEHSNTSGRSAVIVGVRSIGATLSAVVSTALKARGWTTKRFTVRPRGHPFDRRVELPMIDPRQFSHAIVVDEGPGISGSSMAATARALSERGFKSISFFPGHEHEPGNAASPETRDIWKRTRRFFTRLEDLRWRGQSLQQTLATKAAELCGSLEPFSQIENCSGGLWRQFAFFDESEWPAVAPQFERMKFRCANARGESVLWKFTGFGGDDELFTDAALKKISRRAEQGFTVPPIGSFRGFVAMPWIQGRRLTAANAINPAVLECVADYILHAAEPRWTPEEHAASVSRLAEMLFWNTREALGEPLAERTRDWVSAAKSVRIPLASGDGHLAPHEWIRVSPLSGPRKIYKADCEGHDCDHTVVGRQCVLWDVAGVMTEWDLDFSEMAPLHQALERSGLKMNPDALTFYFMAYAAFRMGLMSLPLSQIADTAEHRRLQSAFFFYQSKLANALNGNGANGTNQSGTRVSPVRFQKQKAIQH